MTINDELFEFAGKPVDDYDPNQGLGRPAEVAYRVSIDYDMFSDGIQINDLIAELLEDPRAGELQALVIGAWDFESSTDSSAIVELLSSSAGTLRSLEALFLADVTVDEQEISWIHHADISALFVAFPALKVLRVRGSDGLRLGPIRHARLEHLAFESGGLPGEVIAAVAAADLPRLTHLELWLGDDGYGYEGSLDLLGPILSGQQFPRLRYLGLKNAQDQDAIARAVASAPILEHLEVLDLSMGTLGDEGAQALLDAPAIRRLRKLDIHRHYLSNDMLAKLSALGIEVDASEQQEETRGDRYVAVSE